MKLTVGSTVTGYTAVLRNVESMWIVADAP
jgi:hypothetical protein